MSADLQARTAPGFNGERLEWTTGQERFYNYCLWEYEPPAPCANKLAASNLLYQSIPLLGFDHERVFTLIERLRMAIGVSNTVWGLKRDGDVFQWEFYFYDYRRRERHRSISAVQQALAPDIHCRIPDPATLNYFMFSIDITPELLAGNNDLEEIHLYIGNIGSNVSSGISYSVTHSGRRLENLYYFFDPTQHQEDIIGKITSSAYIDPPDIDLQEILWPELSRCSTICLANKRTHDCIYFSGINIDQFIWFLDRMEYPGVLSNPIKANRDRLDHLLFDVGIDYRYEADGLKLLKSGYYGTF